MGKPMNLWIVEDGKYALYERKGECLGCGECCRGELVRAHVTLSQDTTDKEPIVPLSDYNGYSVFQVEDVWKWYKTEFTEEPHVCGSLNGNKCDWWQTDGWPEICRYWPFHPRDLDPFPKCGFSFERKLNA